jgi:large subunit ribosomal protein L28
MVTGKVALVGNNVSHANNRTKRRFLPAVKTTRLYSEILGKMVSIKLTNHGQRSVEHKGGLDAWLLGTAPSRLAEELLPLREQIKAKAKLEPKAKAKFRKPAVSARLAKKVAAKKAAK